MAVHKFKALLITSLFPSHVAFVTKSSATRLAQLRQDTNKKGFYRNAFFDQLLLAELNWFAERRSFLFKLIMTWVGPRTSCSPSQTELWSDSSCPAIDWLVTGIGQFTMIILQPLMEADCPPHQWWQRFRPIWNEVLRSGQLQCNS